MKSWVGTSPVNKYRIPFFIMLCLLFLCSNTLHGRELIYDMATGKLTGFDLTSPDANVDPSHYAVAREFWQMPGFVGRLSYLGPPTTLTFINTGSSATGTTNGMFYFTYLTEGVSRLDYWREFFLVTRVKGLTHNGVHVPITQTNTVITSPGGTVTITEGGGLDEVEPGEPGYNSRSEPGTYDGSNGYKYKYTYKHIWIDVTFVKTNQGRPVSMEKGYYVTQFMATDPTGLNYTLRLIGEVNKGQGQSPSSYYYGVEKTVPDFFPFTDMQYKNSSSNSLKVGELLYLSPTDKAEVRFASDRAGSQANFIFNPLGAGATTPFNCTLVFDSIEPNEGRKTIKSPNKKFKSKKKDVMSPIDGRITSSHIIKGDIYIYVKPGIQPSSGTYQTTVYCILTVD